ncbi:hypothetical protein PIB30_075798 [Stylosanthes scabra]|uniref:Uncharacterized protein n=1 Tax=Stylosanthes scabra TaxID=79078 RepID=A0ABU6TQ56_9FABA|nr:hypothetical protein [Stylosanthes scabra]
MWVPAVERRSTRRWHGSGERSKATAQQWRDEARRRHGNGDKNTGEDSAAVRLNMAMAQRWLEVAKRELADGDGRRYARRWRELQPSDAGRQSGSRVDSGSTT